MMTFIPNSNYFKAQLNKHDKQNHINNNTVQSQFSDTLFSDKSRFTDNFAEDYFFST